MDEGDSLHASMKETVQFASEMNCKMASFVWEQDASAKGFEASMTSRRPWP